MFVNFELQKTSKNREFWNVLWPPHSGTKLCTALSEAEFPWMFVSFIVVFVPKELGQKVYLRFRRLNKTFNSNFQVDVI